MVINPNEYGYEFHPLGRPHPFNRDRCLAMLKTGSAPMERGKSFTSPEPRDVGLVPGKVVVSLTLRWWLVDG